MQSATAMMSSERCTWRWLLCMRRSMRTSMARSSAPVKSKGSTCEYSMA